jgi:hypothetical protein
VVCFGHDVASVHLEDAQSLVVHFDVVEYQIHRDSLDCTRLFQVQSEISAGRERHNPCNSWTVPHRPRTLSLSANSLSGPAYFIMSEAVVAKQKSKVPQNEERAMNRSLLLYAVAVATMIATRSAQAQNFERGVIAGKTGLVLTAPQGPAGLTLQQEAPDPRRDDQVWDFLPVAPNVFRIVNPKTQMALEVVQGDSRTPVSLYPIRDVPTQYWFREKIAGSNYFYLRPWLHQRMCVDVPGGSRRPGGIQIYKSNGSDAQQFNLIPLIPLR